MSSPSWRATKPSQTPITRGDNGHPPWFTGGGGHVIAPIWAFEVGGRKKSHPIAPYLLESRLLVWIPQALALSRESLRPILGFPTPRIPDMKSPHPVGEEGEKISVQAGQTSATHLGKVEAQLSDTGATSLPSDSSVLPGVVAALGAHRAVSGRKQWP